MFPGSKWPVLMLGKATQDAMSTVFDVFPERRIWVYVYDLLSHLRLVTLDMPQSAKNLHVVLKAEMMSIALGLFCHKEQQARKD